MFHSWLPRFNRWGSFLKRKTGNMIYKNAKDVIYSVQIKQEGEKLKMLFSCDGGKFGTDEILDEIEISVKGLLNILQKQEFLTTKTIKHGTEI